MTVTASVREERIVRAVGPASAGPTRTECDVGLLMDITSPSGPYSRCQRGG